MMSVADRQSPEIVKIWAALDDVVDPEIPVLTIVDMGIVRDVSVEDGNASVVITPTYSGCPAMATIELEITVALARAGYPDAKIKTVLSPAWSTDWLSHSGREKLRNFGIAPPVKATSSKRALFAQDTEIACPRCGSTETERVSEFGSTACKALYKCTSCLEPFDYFKCI